MQRDRFEVLINPKDDLAPERDRSLVAVAPNADERAVFWPILTLERAANGDRSRPVCNSVVWARGPHLGGYFGLQDPSSHWIERPFRLPNGSTRRFFFSSGRPDYKGENGADQHDSSNHFEGLCIL